ncbi:MAG: hypothetical protein Q9187_002590 [Circinaria calcarea]
MIPPKSFSLKGTSIRIPSRGLGTFQPDPKAYPNTSVKDSVLQALKVGYRHLDAALAYGFGTVEKDIGAAIRESGIPREEIFIVTKLHNCFHAPEDVSVGMNISLQNLGLSYVPYAYVKTETYGTQRGSDGKPLIDIPMSKAYNVTWTAMEKLVEEGKTKLIGVSNFSSPKLKKLLKTAKIHPVANQIELHPYFPQKGLVEYCQSNDIHIIAHSPLGGLPIPVLVGRHGPGPLEDPVISDLAQKYCKTPAQIILCHSLCRGISVIPKTNNPKRIVENFDILFDLEEDDFRKVDELMGVNGENGVRNLEMTAYLGFDNFNEVTEEP